MTAARRASAMPGRGTDSSRRRVYGWSGDARIVATGPASDDPAPVHDDHLVGDLTHDCEIV